MTTPSVRRFWVLDDEISDEQLCKKRAALDEHATTPPTVCLEVVLASDHDAAMQQHEKVVGERNAALEELDQIDYICSASDIPEQRIVSRQGEPDLDFIPTVERVRQLKDALASKNAELVALKQQIGVTVGGDKFECTQTYQCPRSTHQAMTITELQAELAVLRKGSEHG